MPIIDAYDAIAKGAREQKRHFSPSGLSDLDRRAFLVGDRGVPHPALSDFDQSAQQNSLSRATPSTARATAATAVNEAGGIQ